MKALATMATAARDTLSRRADAVGTALFLSVLLFIFSRLWLALAQGRETVGGYSVAQLVIYLLVTELVVMGPGYLHVRIAADVRSGDVALHLLRPIGYVEWEVARGAGTALVRVLTLLLVGAPVAVLLAGVPRLDVRGVAFGLLVLVPLAVFVETCARVLIGLLAFWLEDSRPVYWIWQKAAFVLGGLMLPLDLYPHWLQRVAAVLPFGALLNGPARTVVAFDAGQAEAAALRLVLWGAAIFLLLHGVHALASRRLQLNGG